MKTNSSGAVAMFMKRKSSGARAVSLLPRLRIPANESTAPTYIMFRISDVSNIDKNRLRSSKYFRCKHACSNIQSNEFLRNIGIRIKRKQKH